MISTHTLTWSVTTRFTALPLYYTNFNSHAHVERDIMANKKHSALNDFNSHAHVERDLWLSLSHACSFHFNSHAHVERDLHLDDSTLLDICHFNSHAHVERDHIRGRSVSTRNQFQLTRSRGA